MIIRLSFKTPDVVDYALEEIEDNDVKVEVEEACKKFVKYGEYLDVDINIETGTAVVIPV